MKEINSDFATKFAIFFTKGLYNMIFLRGKGLWLMEPIKLLLIISIFNKGNAHVFLQKNPEAEIM